MATKNLDDLKNRLYEVFDVAADNGMKKNLGQLDHSNERVAVGTIAQAIVQVELAISRRDRKNQP